MNLLDGGCQLQFLRRIPEHFLVRRAVVKPVSSAVDDRDHIRSILGDDFKQLIALGQFATNSLELELLIDRVDIE